MVVRRDPALRAATSTRARAARAIEGPTGPAFRWPRRAFEDRQRNVDPFAVEPLERWREQQRSERIVPPPRAAPADHRRVRAATCGRLEYMAARSSRSGAQLFGERDCGSDRARTPRCRPKVAKLETRIAVLEAKQEHGIGEIIDLPSPISRRRRDALAAKSSRLASTCAFANFGCWRREPSSRSAADATLKVLHDFDTTWGNVGRVPTSADLPHRQGVSRSNRMQTLANRQPAAARKYAPVMLQGRAATVKLVTKLTSMRAIALVAALVAVLMPGRPRRRRCPYQAPCANCAPGTARAAHGGYAS